MSISIGMLEAFVKVAERLSVSAAAADLGLGKSVVSKRIAQLEALVSATLFSRSTRQVALTPAGDAYLASAQRMLQEMALAQERLRGLRTELSGLVRLTAPVSWGRRMLAKRLPEFLRLHPGIEVELQLADQMLDLAQARVDIALRWTTASSPDLCSQPVARVAWVIVAAPAYLLAAGAPQAPQELAAHPCMSYWRESSDDVWTLSGAAQREQVRVRSRYHANNAEAVADAALAGLGVALLPRYVCDDALASGQLVTVLDGWTPLTKFGTHITALATPERMRLARNRALVEFLRGQFGLSLAANGAA